ncbi:MAG: hypothetical protein HYR60_05895 [Acidobacteria bacterium]|nr:hypothetical protein [Acidobacteriota bacterium]
MIPELRRRFNAAFTPAKYQAFLDRINRRCGTEVKFRHSETPCFFPPAVLDKMAAYGRDLIRQLLTPDYLARSARTIPAAYRVPNEPAHPLFLQADFGLDGNLEPKLVEIQGFPSLYAYQPALAIEYLKSYDLDPSLRFLLGGLDIDGYHRLLRRAILGDCDPGNVILMEIEPLKQKTLPDFLLTERLCGIRAVCITEIRKEGRRLFHGDTPIHRIYNRAIVDELQRRGVRPAFDFRDDLDVEWAGHPNWYFRISKFSIPYLRHACVPKTWFLDELEALPDDLDRYVLKPLYSFAGLGVKVGVARDDLAAIPPARRHDYILQERVNFASPIDTPHGPTQAEVRVMYIWDGPEPVACTSLVRMGRGKMMGVDHNRDLEWVGASAGFYPPA